jgi:hypothetical protein
MIPVRGQIWILENDSPGEDIIKAGGRVTIVDYREGEEFSVKINYILQEPIKTYCQEEGYDNGFSLDSFLRQYHIDEAYEVSQILKQYK